MTSCLVVFSISSMRAASAALKLPAFASHSSIAACGTRPAFAIARPAASSTESQVW